ncbi:ribose-phosphate pyrophosphokinase [SAR202 cluster bacterium AC-409-J13_OGT_754m]|nr:ribose-phosphate pyrophosphokinase [SAR202 cluster bacterium AC-409-J13_OGT_754m]
MTDFMGELCVLSGNAHQSLASKICEYLKIPLGQAEVFKFPNDNTFVRIKENVRERDVFIVQPMSVPVNDNLMELLIMIDAAKRASAGRVTAVIPYYGYARTDKKDQPRVPITARLVADLLTAAGANRILTVDLHAGQIQGFFNIPVDELTALPILVDYFSQMPSENLSVVAIDIGISKKARDVAERLKVPLAIIEKRRQGNDSNAQSLNVIGDVKGRDVLTFDDEIDTGGSILSAVDALKVAGAGDIYCCVTHPVFSGSSLEKMVDSPIREFVATDTLPIDVGQCDSKVTILSVAPLLGEAIHRIHGGLSVGALFEYHG